MRRQINVFSRIGRGCKMPRVILVLLLVISLVLGSFTGCAKNPVTGKKELMFFSERDEIALGKRVYPNAIWGAEGGGGPYRDDRLKSYLGGVITRIHGISHRPHLPVTFEIQNSSVPNAWAIPGYVVITRGLLAGLANEAEFAFVMGHEMGHVSARHSARQMSQGILLNIGLVAAGLALGDAEGADLVVGLGAVGGTLLLLKYSRDDELEADRLGVQYMARLGYDPNAAITAHQNLERVSQEYLRSVGGNPAERSAFEELLSTHPRTARRIDEIRQIINTTPRSPMYGDGTNSAQFQSMVYSLRNSNNVYRAHYDKAVTAYESKQYNDAINHLRNAILQDRYQPPFYALTGFVYSRQKKYAEAEQYFNGALTLDPNYQPALRGLGIVNYQRKDYQQAAARLNRSVSIFPDDALSHYYLGMSYYQTNSCREAIPSLARYAEARPKNARIHGLLGTCYERIGDFKSAYNAYQRQIQVAGDNDMGRQAKERLPHLQKYVDEPKKK